MAINETGGNQQDFGQQPQEGQDLYALKPENIPGTPEYGVTKTDELRRANDFVWTELDRALKGRDSSAVSAFFRESKKDLDPQHLDDVAWRVVKFDRPQADIESSRITDSLIPVARSIKDANLQAGRKADIIGMDDQSLTDFIASADLPDTTKTEVIREVSDSTYRKTKELLGTAIVPRIRKQLLQLDDKYAYGETALREGKPFFDKLDDDGKVEAFKAMAYYKARQPGAGIGGAIEAGLGLVGEFATATVGAVDSLTPDGKIENKPEYLSKAFRNDPEKMKRLETVMAFAGPAISNNIRLLNKVSASGDVKGASALLDKMTDLDNPANQEFVDALAQLALLRQEGAFVRGSKWEKLSSFGSGVIDGMVAFKHFVADSTDPNSFLFMREHEQDVMNTKPVTNIVQPTINSLINQFRDSDAYWEGKPKEEILRAVQTWGSNWDNLNSANKNAISRAYKAVGLEDDGKFAETAYGDKRLSDAATASYDPITIAVGGARLLGLAGKGSLALPKLGALSAEGKALMTEAQAIAADVAKADATLTPIADRVRVAFKQATGREITNDEALALIVSGQNTAGISATLIDDANKAIADVIAKNEIGVGNRIANLQAKVKDFAGRMVAVAPEAQRPVSGALLSAAATAAEKGGIGMQKLGTELSTGVQKSLFKRGVNWVLSNQNPWVARSIGVTTVGGVIGGSFYASGEGDKLQGLLSGGAIATGILATSYVLTPKNLVAAGSNIEMMGRLNQRVAKAISTGEKVSGSAVQAAIRSVRDDIVLADVAKDATKMEQLTKELTALTWLSESGAEQAMKAGFHVVMDDLVQGGTTGSMLAFANDKASAAYGFGMGATSAVGMRAMSRMAVTPHANELVRGKESIAEVIAIDQQLAPDQSSRLRQWLNESKDYKEFVDRADSYRKAWNFTGGRIILSNGVESATVGHTYNLPAEEINRIRSEANALHPDDPTAAALFADGEIAKKQNLLQDRVNYDAATQLLAESNRKVESSQNKVLKLTDNIKATKDALAQKGQTTSEALVRMENDLANETNALKLHLAENTQIAAKHSELGIRVENPAGWRQYETRQTVNGTGMRQVMKGMFVDDTGYIHINIENADRLTMIHEAFEAILKDDAVRPLVKDMNEALWAKEDSGKRRLSDPARDALFQAYASSLTPEQSKAYFDEMNRAKAEYDKSGNYLGLERFTREALSWWMATIDTEARGVGYGGTGQPKQLTNVRGEGFGDILKRVTVGERTLFDVLNTDNLRSEFSAFFDPNIGLVPRSFASNVVGNMREAGMRFIAASDGTVRGFFLNSRGETVRDPVIVKMYESVYRLTGGKGSPRLSNAPIEALTGQQRADIFRSTGLDWFLDNNGNPLPDPSTPPPAQPTGTAGAGGAGGGTGGTAAPTPRTPAPGVPAGPTVRDVMSGHSELILTAIRSVNPSNRGLQFSVDTEGKGVRNVIWGKPTDAEIEAVTRIQSLPQTVKENMVTLMRAMQIQGERPVLTARYANVFSRNLAVETEARQRISNNYGFVSDRQFSVIGLEFNTRYYTKDGKSYISEKKWSGLDPASQANYTKSTTLQAHTFDNMSFLDSTTVAFNEGIRIYDKSGNHTGYVKDGSGRDITAARMRELFFDDREFFSLANEWLKHYVDGGAIDPTSVEKPGGKIVEPSAKVLGGVNGDEVLGNNRLTALRAIHGFTVRNGRIVVNPTNFTNQYTRGLNNPFMNLDISSLGQIRDTGIKTMVQQEAVTRAQFNMDPAKWEKRSSDFAVKFRPSTEFNETTGLWTHPELRDTYILQTRGGGVNQFEIFVDGENVPNVARNIREATDAAREKLKTAEDMLLARQYAEAAVREVAQAQAREEAKAKTEAERKAAKDKKDYDRRLTAAEKQNIREVEAGNKSWLDSIRDLELREARAQVEFEAAQKKDAKTASDAAEKLRLLKEQFEQERARVNQQLKVEIEQRQQLDNDAIAKALKDNQGKVDFAELATRGLLIPRESLPIAITSQPLVLTRVYNSGGTQAKRVVTQPTAIVPQTGAGPTAGAGELAAGRTLGTQEFGQGVKTIDRYLKSGVEATIAINKTIDAVWKTELGNQLVMIYNGMDAAGKPSYRYHLYGANGVEVYNTTKLADMYRAVAVNEHRLRNKQSPTSAKPGALEMATNEARLMMAGESQTYIQQQGYVGGAGEKAAREEKRQKALADKYTR